MVDALRTQVGFPIQKHLMWPPFTVQGRLLTTLTPATLQFRILGKGLLGIHKMFRRRLLATSLPKMFLGSLNQTWKILERSCQKAFLRVLQNVLLLKMILIWRMWLKRSLRKPPKGFVNSRCKGRVHGRLHLEPQGFK